MTGLVSFLAARLDDDEAAAKAATPGPWAVGGTPGAECLPRDFVHAPDYQPEGFSRGQHVGDASVAAGGMGPWAVQVSGSGFPRANAVHIALHDPARVLAEVAAGRARISLYERAARQAERTGHGTHVMMRDALLAVLRIDAVVFADHPDYKQAWAPGAGGL